MFGIVSIALAFLAQLLGGVLQVSISKKDIKEKRKLKNVEIAKCRSNKLIQTMSPIDSNAMCKCVDLLTSFSFVAGWLNYFRGGRWTAIRRLHAWHGYGIGEGERCPRRWHNFTRVSILDSLWTTASDAPRITDVH